MYARSQINPTVWGVLASLMLTTTTAPSLVFVVLTALDYLPWPLRDTRLTFGIQYKTDEVIFSIYHVVVSKGSTSFLIEIQLISHSRLINQSRVKRGYPLGPRICRQPQRAPNPIRTRHTQPTHSAIFYRPGLPGALRDHLSVCLAGPPPQGGPTPCPPIRGVRRQTTLCVWETSDTCSKYWTVHSIKAHIAPPDGPPVDLG